MMSLDVLEGLEICLGALRAFAQDQATIAQCEMSALPIRDGALCNFHGEGDAIGSQPTENSHVEHGAEIIRVGHEGEADPLGSQRIEHSGFDQRGIEIPVARWAPLELGRFRPFDRRTTQGVDSRNAPLQKIEGQRTCELRKPGQGRERIIPGLEAIHQDQRQRDPELLARPEHLSGDQIEKGKTRPHRQQTLGHRESHSGPEPAVQFDDRDVMERLAASGFKAFELGIVR